MTGSTTAQRSSGCGVRDTTRPARPETASCPGSAGRARLALAPRSRRGCSTRGTRSRARCGAARGAGSRPARAVGVRRRIEHDHVRGSAPADAGRRVPHDRELLDALRVVGRGPRPLEAAQRDEDESPNRWFRRPEGQRSKRCAASTYSPPSTARSIGPRRRGARNRCGVPDALRARGLVRAAARPASGELNARAGRVVRRARPRRRPRTAAACRPRARRRGARHPDRTRRHRRRRARSASHRCATRHPSSPAQAAR